MKVPVLESVFLNRSALPEERDYRRVLVLAGDVAGSELVAQLSLDGFDVLLMPEGNAHSTSVGFNSHHDIALEEVQGFAGGFEVTIRRDHETHTDRVGFIVAAGDPDKSPRFSQYALTPSERVISLSDLEWSLRSRDSLPISGKEWFHAVFLCGLAGDSNPHEFLRILSAIEELHTHEMVQTYVFMRHAKVAAWSMEKRYRKARESGTIFFKLDGPGPVFEHDEQGLTMAFEDPILNMEVELIPDLLVVDETTGPPASLKPLLEAIPAAQATRGYLQPESTRFTGGETPKAGILAVGPSKGNFDPETYPADAEAVMAALKHPGPKALPPDFPGPPVIDLAACTVCLTCVRLCPHGAMSFKDRAYADPVSCVRCGICAAECPMNAITLPPPSEEPDVMGRIAKGLQGAEPAKTIVALLCSRSAARAMQAAGPGITRNLAPVVVPCAGTVDESHILSAFRAGAGAVLVAGCHTGNCASIYGTVLASQRSAAARKVLVEAGFDPERLRYVTVAANAPGDFARAVIRLEERLGLREPACR